MIQLYNDDEDGLHNCNFAGTYTLIREKSHAEGNGERHVL